jgi:RHS repeat-associated protein
MDGKLWANGVDDHGAAGSGGGIYVAVGTLAGGGSLQAKGGNSGQGYGSGGGGRIAVYAGDYSGFNLASITAPGGSNGVQGGAGSVYVIKGRAPTRVYYVSPVARNSNTVVALSPLVLAFSRSIQTNASNAAKIAVSGPLGFISASGILDLGGGNFGISFPAMTANGLYHFTVLPTLLDAEGFHLDQNANGIPGEPDDGYTFTLILDTVPPRITHHEPEGDVAGTVSSVDVWFSEVIDAGTFNVAQVAILTPTNATVPATSVAQVGLNRWRTFFPGQTATGRYRVSISTNVTDLAGNPLATDSGPLTFNLVPVDLQLSNVTVSTNQLTAGDAVTVSWTGGNATGAPLLGGWTDAVYLSADNRWDLGDIRVASVGHIGGLATNEVYTAQATFFVPGVLPGNYYFVIRADVYEQEKEPSGDTGNQTASLALPLTVPVINPNGGVFSGVLTPGKPSAWLAIQLAPGQNLGLYLHGLGGSSATELYVSFGAMPSRLNFDYSAVSGETDFNRQDHQLAITTPPAGGTFYVLVYGDGIGSSNPFQLFASTGAFLVTSITPDRISNKQPLGYLSGGLQFGNPPSGCVIPSSVTVSGAGFDETTSVQFIAPSGAVQTSTATHLISPSTLVLDLSPTNWSAGLYNVRILKAGDSYTRTNAFTVVQNGLPNLQTHLIVPSAVGFNIPIRQTIWLEYTNAGDAAMPAPLLKLHGDYSALLTPDPALAIPFSGFNGAPPGVADTVQVMARGSGATPGTLQPGDSGRIPIYYVGLGQVAHYPNVTFSLSALTADDVSWSSYLRGWGVPGFVGQDWHIGWDDSMTRNMCPASIPIDAWFAISASLQTQLGLDWGNYVEALANDMNYLKTIGQDVTDVGQLWNFEVAKASGSLTPVSTLASSVDASAPSPGFPLVFRRVYGQSIISRYHLGPLGRGWSHNWEISLEVANNGNVTVLGPSGSVRLFTFKNGRFYNSTGDYGTLTSSGGAYRITETDQTVWQFRADNLLDYVQDNNSNRITCGYTSGLLTTVTHSSGKQFVLDYDGNGRLWHVTDPLGPGSADDRVTTYQYDASGQHLLTVTKPGSRTMTYAYDSTTSVLQRSHALTLAINPDNTTNTFAYDDHGRLTQTAKGCCGGSPITFVYDSNGTVTVVDATSRTNVISYGLGAQIAQVRDGAGRIVTFSYDGTNQLTQLLGPSGEQYRYSYGANGKLMAVQDPLRHSSSFAFDPVLNRLTQVTDARYNSMQYRRDSRGNVTSIVYADNSHEDFGYDGYGNMLTYTNRRGNVISYAYNSAGQLTNKNYLTAQGRVDYNYSYDAAGNLRTAIGPEGTNSLDYFPNTDWLQRIAYPGGQWFTFEYDAVGRRTKRNDQDGNMVAYAYDAQGRLDTMTNGLGQLIVNYQYDNAGRLHRKTLGNGVYTTYDYNSAGQVTNLINAKADSTVLSAYAYEYDSSGRRTSMRVSQPRPGLPDGSWTEIYGYDPIGQLTSVNYSAPPNGTQGVSSVTYAYDAAGNRTQVQGDGGTAFTDVYAANVLNQYSSAGAGMFSYDADGNLTTNIESSVATAYGYDAENRLVSVKTPTDTWAYTYDAFGKRIATTHNGATTRYVVDPAGFGNVAAEYDGGGNLVARYDHGFGLLDRIDATSQPAFYTFSAIGNTAELTDSAGAPLNTYTFDPWGLSLRNDVMIANPFGFVGEFGVMQDGNGLGFMRARFYDSGTGRFSQTDPLGMIGGLNLYSYVRNDPIQSIDPRGTKEDTWGDIGKDILKELLPYFGWVGIGGKVMKKLQPTAFEPDPQPPFHLPSDLVIRPDPAPPAPPPDGPDPNLPASDFDLPGGHQTPHIPPWIPPDIPGGSQIVTNAHSFDPNDKRGPNGVGSGHFIRSGDSLSYQVSFENEADATAPARLITITDVLDASLDLNTFELSEIAFGNQFISVVPGLNHYEGTEFMAANGTTIAVQIQAALDINTRTLTVTLSALDPTTGWYPEDPLVGLLYPEDGTGRGTGSVTYRVRPLAGLPSRTVIRNRATIVFDYNDPIQTPEVFNTLDSGAPTSSVQPLPTLSGTTFQIQWSGQDDPGGVGIADYTIYASADGTNYVPWLQTGSSGFASFRGTPGNTYFFYSIARDLVGNAQPVPALPQTVTTVPTNAPVLASITNLTTRPGDTLVVTNQVLQGKPVGAWLFTVDPSAPSGASVNPTNGVFRWTPSCGQASTTNLITVWVTDSGWTNLTDVVSFTVTVSDCVVPSLGQLVLRAGDSGRLPVNLISSVPLTNLAMTVNADPSRLTNLWVEPVVAEICQQSITFLTNDFYWLSLATCSNQFLIGTQQVAWLHFTTISNQSSAFVRLQLDNIVGYQPDGTAVQNFAPQSGRLVIIGEEPLLEAMLNTNRHPAMILYGKPASGYAIQTRTNFVAGPWATAVTNLTVGTELLLQLPTPASASAVNFYRALRWQ